jgi:hypothetical protein
MSDFCGFMCSYHVEKLEDTISELKGLKKVNPEFAEEFKNKLIDMLKAV